MRVGWKAVDIMLHGIHLSLIFMCTLGWMFEPTRTFHLLLIVLVTISWFGLGWFFGFGYCILTDTQWRIKRQLGQEPVTDSYVKYMLDKMTGHDIDQKITDNLTNFIFLGAVILSVVVNFIP